MNFFKCFIYKTKISNIRVHVKFNNMSTKIFVSDITTILPIYSRICKIKMFTPPQVLIAHLRRFISLNRLCECNSFTFHKSKNNNDNNNYINLTKIFFIIFVCLKYGEDKSMSDYHTYKLLFISQCPIIIFLSIVKNKKQNKLFIEQKTKENNLKFFHK